MNHVGGKGFWFGAAELAELKLPGLPSTKRKINELAEAQRWLMRSDAAGRPLHRRRAGKGGGYEYHVALLPQAASLELIRRGMTPSPTRFTADSAPEPQSDGRDSLWTWFDAQPDKVKADAKRRLKVVEAVDSLVNRTGATVTAAVASVAASHGVSPATIHNWRGFVAGARLDDWLPRLAPRRVGGGAKAEIDDQAWQIFLSHYLRFSEPPAADSYRAAKENADARGVAIPHLKTFMRKVDRDVDPRLVAAKRKGQDALRAMIPHQKRSVAELQALELVNIDGHKWDVFVRWPDGTIARPMMVAIQDVYSRKFLSWRIGETESAVLTRLAFADLFRDWGIPDGCLMDNGRAFASKWITGGAKTRFRFKIRQEEPTGLLTSLGVKVHWALPFRGSSKPIERGFRDFCSSIAKHPAFEGAYTGNRPDAKPENYGERAVDLDVFVKVVNAGIAAHNARLGRTTEMARGGSFDGAFDASYSRSSIRRAGPEQLRRALLAADQVRAKKNTGEIEIFGNRYWSDALYGVAGQLVTVRFDPDALQRDAQGNAAQVHVYDQADRYVAAVPVVDAVGFLDAGAAKTRARQEQAVKKAAKELERQANLLNAAQLADLLGADDEENFQDAPTPAAIRPVRAQGRAMAAVRAQQAPVRASVVDRLADAFADHVPTPIRPSLTILDGGLE